LNKENGRIICLNVQGFIKHKDEIEHALLGENRPSVLGFTETHVTNMIEDFELQINGYECVRGNSESSRTGGVLLYLDKSIKYEVITINTCERNWWTITVKISDKNYKGILMLIYHSPSSSDSNFLDFLDEACNSDILSGNVIVMGDFNIDMKLDNYCQNKLIRIMNSVGLKQLVKEPTRIVNTSETIIDLIFTNVEVEVKVNNEPKITDHSILVIYWNICVKEKANRTIVCRDYKRMNVDEFMEMVSIGLDAIEDNTVDVMASSAVNTIIECLDKVAPKKKIKLQSKWQEKQWFSEEIRQILKQRDEAYKLARLIKSNEEWELFRQLRNKAVDVCRKAKRDYLELRLDKNKKDPKKMWGLLKELLKGNSFSDNICQEIQCKNIIFNNPDEMANIFNRFFIDSITVTKKDDCEIDLIRNRKYTENEFEAFSLIEVGYLYHVVKKLANKSGTEEGITVDIMKKVVAVAGTKLCCIFNRSLQEGIVPCEWKQALVIPIPKVRGTKKVEEFRPINKLPIYEKILEIIVHRQLVEYLEDKNLLEECQSGFRARHSCETALQWVVSSWKRSLGEGKMIGVVFLDLRRAFELVNRDILIKKMEWYGIKGVVLSWFKSYLENRTQKVKFNGILSDPIDVKLGVPQGSVLGPLLFLLYINDVTKIINENCELRLFADDALIYTTGYSSIEINENLNEQMAKVDKWLKINRLQLNVNKTKVMLVRGIRKKVSENSIKVKLENSVLEVVSEIKYLGVIIDKNLSFSENINYMGKKIGSKLGVLRRVSVELTPYMRCVVYKTIVAPLFEYCSSIMLSVNDTNLQYLQKLQNKGMRTILRCNNRTRVRDMLEALQFMSVKERIEYNVYILVHKMVNGLCPEYLVNKIEFIGREESMHTRQRGNIYINKCKTSEEQKMLLHDGLKIYNNLPKEIKNEKSLQNFKRALVPFVKNRERGVNAIVGGSNVR
jgi:hypothetical protein